VTEVQRMSMRLLRKVAAYASRPEAAMFCEMRAASVCRIESQWCSMASLFDTEHQPYLFAGKQRWVNTWVDRVNRSQMEARMASDVLWHGYKWENEANSSFAGTLLYGSQLAALGAHNTSTHRRRNVDAPLKTPQCESLVPDPIDAPPMRSPQAVHSTLLPRISGKDLVEIGTRNGDGISCYAQFARRATAIELSPAYCKKLRERSGRLLNSTGHSFSVDCRSYQKADLDADVITWWAEEPILTNWGVLQTLARQMQLGHVRTTAEALLVFDPQWPPDLSDWQDFGAALSIWSANVSVHEKDKCKASSNKKLRSKPYLCKRAEGIFHVAAFTIGTVPRSPRPRRVDH